MSHRLAAKPFVFVLLAMMVILATLRPAVSQADDGAASDNAAGDETVTTVTPPVDADVDVVVDDGTTDQQDPPADPAADKSVVIEEQPTIVDDTPVPSGDDETSDESDGDDIEEGDRVVPSKTETTEKVAESPVTTGDDEKTEDTTPELLEIPQDLVDVTPPMEPDDGQPYYEADLVSPSTMRAMAAGPVSPGTVTNPPLAAACGITIMLVVDSSGSIGSDAGQVKDAVTAFLSALAGTGSYVGVVDFNTSARLAVPYSLVDDASIDGVFDDYLDSYRSGGGTNWDDAFHRVNQAGAPDLVLVVTDGRPTYSNPNGHNEDPTDGETGPGGGDTTESHERELAADEADDIKSAGAHMFVVGVGNALGNPSAGDLESIQAISGDVRYPTAGQPIGQSDYALVSQFSDLASAVRHIVIELCSPSVTVRKLVQIGDGAPQAAAGWEFTADVELASDPHGYQWIGPDDGAAPGAPVSGVTGAAGLTSWQWEPFNPLDKAAVTITETLQPGYRFVGAECRVRTIDTEDEPLAVSVDTGDASLELTASEGEIITCDVTNEKLATIVVEKQTAPDGDPASFAFTGDVAGSIGDGETVTVTDLVPGTYTSTEAMPPGWRLAGISCDDADSTGSTATATATFRVAAGETVRCVFTNEKAGRIVVEKIARPASSSETFAFSGSLDGSIAHGGTLVADVVAGTYTATEAVTSGWDLSALTCDNADSTGNLDTATATFQVDAGETVTCTFENTRRGSIRIVKQTVPAATGGVFDFTGDLAGEIGDGEMLTATSVIPGTYTATEATVDGWTLTGLTCDDDDSTGDPTTATATFEVAPGESVVCIFVNTADAEVIVDKTLVSGPTRTGDGTYDLVYEIDVTNTGGPGTYDLADRLAFGDDVSVAAASVVNTAPGTIVTDAGWDGTATTSVVTGQTIGNGDTHTYRVTVEASVAASITTDGRDCVVEGQETGTGFLNTATLTVDGVSADVSDCGAVPEADIDVVKTLTSGPTLNVAGTYDLVYELVVTNGGEGPGAYDLVDGLRFGDGVSVIAAAAANTLPGTVVTNPAWDGVTVSSLASAVGIAADTEHVFTVTVEAAIATSILADARDCVVVGQETGSGFLNTATLTVDGADSDASDCGAVPQPGIDVAKNLVAMTQTGRSVTVEYEVVVTNTGDGPGLYDLADELRFGGGIDVASATVSNELPGSIAANPAWDGRSETAIVTAEGIAAASAHSYRVTVVAQLAPSTTWTDLDCELDGDETGTGFLNTATVDSEDGERSSEDCAGGDRQVDLSVDKTADAPVVHPGGSLDYTITVSNNGEFDALADAIVTDAFPMGLTVEAVDGPSGVDCDTDVEAREVTCTIAAELLGAGESVAVVVTARVDDDAGAGDLVNTAVVDSPEDPADCEGTGSGADNCDDATVEIELLGVVSGVLWHDDDRDGVKNPTETRLAGVTVRLLDADGGEIATTTTDDAGYYEFTGAPASAYGIAVVAATLPTGMSIPTYERDGALDSAYAFTLVAGGAERDVDFGYDSPVAVPDDNDDETGTPGENAPPAGTPKGGSLPFTGLAMQWFTAIGLGLLLGGSALVLRARPATFGGFLRRRRLRRGA